MSRLSFDQTRQLLAISPEFLKQSVAKGRLTPVSNTHLNLEDAQFSADDVAKFGELLQRLKSGGIATMLDIAASGKSFD